MNTVTTHLWHVYRLGSSKPDSPAEHMTQAECEDRFADRVCIPIPGTARLRTLPTDATLRPSYFPYR